MRTLNFVVPVSLFLLACGAETPPPKDDVKPVVSAKAVNVADAAPVLDKTADLQALAKDAYVWGYPLVYFERTKRTMTNLAHVPTDIFQHQSKLASPATAEAWANNDVLVSSAWVELKDEPVVLKLPDTGSRWYVLEFVDMWGNPFTHLGKKTSGNKGGSFVITGPGQTATLTKGQTEIKAPTSSIWILARTQVDGEADVVKLIGTLKSMTLTPVSGKAPAMPPAPEARPQDIRFSDAGFFDELGEMMKLYPPPASDDAMVNKLAAAGIGPGLTPSKTLGEKEVLALKDGQKAGESSLEEAVEKLPLRKNGWNLDRKFGDWGSDAQKRGAYAKIGFAQGSSDPDELFAPTTNTDDGGQILTGAHEYVLHFEKGKTPPVEGFWTLTLYSSKGGGLVDNAKKRWSVGNRTGLKPNADGTLDIHLSVDAPKTGDSNWLPAPKGDAFLLTLRMYQPKVEAVTYELPAVKKIK